jgi:hypothetical protein
LQNHRKQEKTENRIKCKKCGKCMKQYRINGTNKDEENTEQ